MGWYVEFLLMERETIRSSDDIESDVLSDLFVVERKLKSLYENKLISKFELYLLDTVINSKSMKSASANLGISRLTLSKMFKGVCNKVSFSLGGIFTDEGYISYMKNRYNLNDEQVNRLAKFIKSEYRHELMKKVFNEN